MSDKDIIYIDEDIETVQDAIIWLEKIGHRNRMLVKWTKFGLQVSVSKGGRDGI